MGFGAFSIFDLYMPGLVNFINFTFRELMLSARHKYVADSPFGSPKKPKINKNRLPLDFFEHSASLQIRKSQQYKLTGVARDNGTPMFGRRRPSPLKIDRQIVTALDKHQNENEQEQILIRDVIFSSRNIRKLRKLSIGVHQSKEKDDKEFSLYTPQLPPIKERRVYVS